jgi:UDP-glucose 4-epimerase
MNILVIGGAGFAGTAIVRNLLESNYKVTVLDITSKTYSNLFDIEDSNLSYIWKSVHDINKEDIRNQEIILHLAAQADVPMSFPSPRWTSYQNIDGVLAALEICRGENHIKKFILASSGNVFGRYGYIPIDENHPLTPHNPYAFSKAAQELAAMSYYRCYGVPVTILSTGVVAGPNMRKEVFLYKWLYNILKNKPTILEGGPQTRDITYITDTVDVFKLAIEAPYDKTIGEKFMISYGEENSVETLLNACYTIVGVKPNIIYKYFRPGEKGQREFFNNIKARTILGYEPKVNPLQAIKLTLEWIQRNQNDIK